MQKRCQEYMAETELFAKKIKNYGKEQHHLIDMP